jgi:hypothetical protein
MFRRTIALALAGLALAAPPALAHSHTHWNSQMKDATDTASRSAGGCSVKTVKSVWPSRSLLVSCSRSHTTTLVYVFPIGRSGSGHCRIQGTPTSGVSRWGRANVHSSVKVSGDALRVTVTVTAGTAVLSTVSVGYYC